VWRAVLDLAAARVPTMLAAKPGGKLSIYAGDMSSPAEGMSLPAREIPGTRRLACLSGQAVQPVAAAERYRLKT
jgi:hypothetical protein